MCFKLLNFHIDADLYRKVLLWESDEFLGACWCLCEEKTHGGAAESCHLILLGDSSQHVDIPESAVSPLELKSWYIYKYNAWTLWRVFLPRH